MKTKRLLSLFAISIFVSLTFAASASAREVIQFCYWGGYEGWFYGDVDGDWDIDSADAQLVLRYVSGLVRLSSGAKNRANVDKD